MGDGGNHSGDGGDDDLWEEVAKTVKPLRGRANRPKAPSRAPRRPVRRDPAPGPVPENSPPAPAAPPGLDRRTEDRLKRGAMKIEGRLDLHGMTQSAARPALSRFIQDAHGAGKRCVLVITGKGRRDGGEKEWYEPKPGILRQRVPEWLRMAPLAPLILRVVPAQQRHGGEGAYYVLLRRDRDRG